MQEYRSELYGAIEGSDFLPFVGEQSTSLDPVPIQAAPASLLLKERAEHLGPPLLEVVVLLESEL